MEGRIELEVDALGLNPEGLPCAGAPREERSVKGVYYLVILHSHADELVMGEFPRRAQTLPAHPRPSRTRHLARQPAIRPDCSKIAIPQGVTYVTAPVRSERGGFIIDRRRTTARVQPKQLRD